MESEEFETAEFESSDFETTEVAAREIVEDIADVEEDEFEDEDDDFEDDNTDYTQTPGKPVLAMSALPITGEPRVDDALARLTDLTNLPVHEHVAVFEDVQRRLHETLADISGQQ